MGRINIGGRMPDGTYAQDFWVEESNFICASGTSLQGDYFKQILGKLCLITSSLIMLPYEGMLLRIVELIAKELRKAVLGEYASLENALVDLRILPKNYEILDHVLIFPLALLDKDAYVEERHFLFIHGGADLIIKIHGKEYHFNMRARGHEIEGLASAHDFCEYINQLRSV